MNEFRATQRVDVFENVFHIVMYAARATEPFSPRDIQDNVMDAPLDTIRKYLAELKERGYLEKQPDQKYVATNYTKEVLNV